jgi:hypothetical protein
MAKSLTEFETKPGPRGGLVRLCHCRRPAKKPSHLCQVCQKKLLGSNNPNYKTGEYTKERIIARAYAKNPKLKELYEEQVAEQNDQIQRHQDALIDTGMLIDELREQIVQEADTEKRLALFERLGKAHTKRANLEATLQAIQLKTTAYLTLDDSMRVMMLLETAMQKIVNGDMPETTRADILGAIQAVNNANRHG